MNWKLFKRMKRKKELYVFVVDIKINQIMPSIKAYVVETSQQTFKDNLFYVEHIVT